jgi:hypothetical protein
MEYEYYALIYLPQYTATLFEDDKSKPAFANFVIASKLANESKVPAEYIFKII